MDIVYRHIEFVYCHIVIVYHRIDVVTCSSLHSATFRATINVHTYSMFQISILYIVTCNVMHPIVDILLKEKVAYSVIVGFNTSLLQPELIIPLL